MSILEALIFGIVQGISEFLPISSTAHIIIAQFLFGRTFPGLSFEVILHLGSIVAVVLYFRRDCIQLTRTFFRYIRKRRAGDRAEFFFGLYIIAATFITGILGIFLEDALAGTMKTPVFIAAALALTGVFLILIERVHETGNRTESEMTFMDSIIVGLAQTIAVIPGISRSGSTLIAALYAGLNRRTAVRYSFLLSIPVIAGSSVLAFEDLSVGGMASIGTLPLLIAFAASFVTSWIGIVWLINFLNSGRLLYFALYCFALAILTITFIDRIPTGTAN
ncbi:undecaprenyl-diphosphate phosphatase [Salibacterium halotolerans]|uniref:Undecaprenyl-diphosphatase n=1 Tax=Salibacterium halotolerans TaxID=1884432 RepID=A0A1I5NSK3_9BACI|nr:undecaprenyl-diphosphate phosphatase [Salibacterium halotolerans]SFP24752.1 undecaprenyl-diphosphatase [Salibacterium halotolerans]